MGSLRSPPPWQGRAGGSRRSRRVPGALGVQEGGCVVLSAALGIGPETGLALSLIKRVRELVLGVPALLVWHFAEGRHLLRSRAAR